MWVLPCSSCSMARGPWQHPPRPPIHTPHLKWRCPSPAHLLSLPTIPARKPIWSSDTFRALSPHHAPGPRQPLQALGVHKKLLRVSGQGRAAGGRGEAVGHSPGSPSGLVPRPCLAFPLVPEKPRGTRWRLPGGAEPQELWKQGPEGTMGPAPPPLGPQHLSLQMGPSAGLEAWGRAGLGACLVVPDPALGLGSFLVGA